MSIKKRSEQDIINVAIDALNREKTSFDIRSLDAIYSTRLSFKNNKKSGWSVSAKLNVPESFEPNMVFVYVSEDDDEVYVPDIL
ncbi:hypothetical protein [Proteus sp. NMG38-2]|uniref:hypothetical protein n=1 Tax=Proteus sp. NMG38-2 TaxID=2883107 RepID=UPI001D0B06D3|nr:hypothetical protein [Proteus sp. NMG38-2]UDN35160.1 hypothetical protein LG402_15635 [Proteus sp. NMG38-2]